MTPSIQRNVIFPILAPQIKNISFKFYSIHHPAKKVFGVLLWDFPRICHTTTIPKELLETFVEGRTPRYF
jgi:hypothetical protein